MKTALFLFLSFAMILVGCSSENTENTEKHSEIKVNHPDVHTYSNVDKIKTTHLHIDLDVNFENNTIYGVARHTMENYGADTAIFYIKGLSISKITLGQHKEEETDFFVGKEDTLLGSPLVVKITPETKFVNIYYQTTEETEALDWLKPEQTSGKKHPYMYTQGQAILTRSWIPLQDTPLNRITYSADVKVPSELMAIMSADNPKTKNNTGNYHFEMKQKIPAYLIALAVGDLKYTALGDKCGVYSEPELADDCAYEFVDLPKMIITAESLYGSYRWDQYDIVVLPYSFPFGGMENPRLTFANPTLIAGDRSLVSVIAHELAHSWSGNLVTNATWNDFWMNEGFTVYFENRIMEEMYGKENADILALVEFQDLEASLEYIAESKHPEDTKLKLDLEHRNPDDGMTDISYIKGAFFLRTLEELVGREKFDAFLKNYFDTHAFETITTEDFLTYLDKELLAPNNLSFNAHEWVYEEGLPENCVKINSKRLDNMENLASLVNNGEDVLAGKLKGKKRGDFITQEWQTFIREMDGEKVTPAQLRALDHQFEFSTNGNPAIKSDWFKLAVRAGYKDARPEMKKYLIQIGRRWYIEGIYQALKDSEDQDDLAFAKEVFEEAKKGYHFVSSSTVEDILEK